MVLFVCVVVALMAAQGVYNLTATMKITRSADDLFKYNLNGVRYALEIKASYFAIANAVNQHLNITKETEYGGVEKTFEEESQALGKAVADLAPLLLDDKERQLLTETTTAVDGYVAQAKEVFQLDRAGRAAEATKIVIPKMRGARQIITANLTKLVDTHIAEAEAANARNRRLADTNRNNSIIGILLVGLMYFSAAFYVPTLIAKPLGEIQVAMDGLAAGDLTKKIPVTGTNELAVLSKVVNQTIDGLRGLVGKVADISGQVAASSEQLASSAEEVGQVTQQVATTIGQLAQGSDQQARAAQETGQVVETMSASIQQVAASAQKMAHDANAAAGTAEEGNRSVGRAIGQMDSVRQTVDQSAVAVKGLGERSQEIGNIVEVITGIADQTNLLALNAAIEAARAGEQGRGFAVVAEEVRKLAEQSRQAAEQISGLIREIQNETQKAVTTMEAGTREVAEGAAVVQGTGRAFDEIAKAVQTVVAQIQEVSAATQSLAAGSQQVVRAVENIASITEEAAAGAEEVSASSQEQTASVEEIAANAEGLSKMAQDLQTAVAVFKL
jgi:methyl-accepting chemotaxis protein